MHASSLAERIKTLNAEKEAMYQKGIDSLIIKAATQISECYEEGSYWTVFLRAKLVVFPVQRISENYQMFVFNINDRSEILNEIPEETDWIGIPFREFREKHTYMETPVISGIKAEGAFWELCEMLEKNGFTCYIDEKTKKLMLAFKI